VGLVALIKLTHVCNIVVRKSERNSALEKYKHRWDDNIKMDTKGIWGKGGYWIQLPQNRIQWWHLVDGERQIFNSSEFFPRNCTHWDSSSHVQSLYSLGHHFAARQRTDK
jgi:hypothetical protein